jgi:hypothetical protein
VRALALARQSARLYLTLEAVSLAMRLQEQVEDSATAPTPAPHDATALESGPAQTPADPATTTTTMRRQASKPKAGILPDLLCSPAGPGPGVAPAPQSV